MQSLRITPIYPAMSTGVITFHIYLDNHTVEISRVKLPIIYRRRNFAVDIWFSASYSIFNPLLRRALTFKHGGCIIDKSSRAGHSMVSLLVRVLLL